MRERGHRPIEVIRQYIRVTSLFLDNASALEARRKYHLTTHCDRAYHLCSARHAFSTSG